MDLHEGGPVGDDVRALFEKRRDMLGVLNGLGYIARRVDGAVVVALRPGEDEREVKQALSGSGVRGVRFKKVGKNQIELVERRDGKRERVKKTLRDVGFRVTPRLAAGLFVSLKNRHISHMEVETVLRDAGFRDLQMEYTRSGDGVIVYV